MSGVVTINFRLMLQQYETQLMAARRLARYRRARRLAEGEEVRIDPDVRRRAMVERVARELYEMILFTGVDNPVVGQIRDRLGVILGSKVRFAYPAGKEGLRLVREEEGKDPPCTAFSDEEQTNALHSLWQITLQAVDESML